jgi:TM2 domain-containing membrane protein YozV
MQTAQKNPTDYQPNNLHAVPPVTLKSDKEFIPTILLCLFLGVLGAHRFYVGKIGTGILQLLTFGGLGIWSMIDLVMIIIGSFKDKNGNPIKSN